MLAVIQFTWWHWVGFIAFVLLMIAIDLGVFNRKAHVIKFREALLWTSVWFCLAMLFALALRLAPESKTPEPQPGSPALTNTVTHGPEQAPARHHAKSAPEHREALEFVTGYLIELSLSMDNVFVIALIFAYFRIPPEYQHRVLFWGIVGALVMRGFMIWAGVALIL